MSMYGTNFAATPNALNPVDQAQKGQDFGFTIGQKLAGINALRGVNLSDPSSVDSAITGLTRLGLGDAAQALIKTNVARNQAAGRIPIINEANSQALASLTDAPGASPGEGVAPPTTAPTDPQTFAAAQAIHKQAASAISDLLNTSDPTLRKDLASAYGQQFAAMHIPQENIDEITGDLSDPGLKAHLDHQTALASLRPGDALPPHPRDAQAAPESLAGLPGGAGVSQAENTLNGPLAKPLVQAVLAQPILGEPGLDVSPGVNQAISLTSPERQAGVQVGTSKVISENTSAGGAIGNAEEGNGPFAGALGLKDANGNIVAYRLADGAIGTITASAAAGAKGTVGQNLVTINNSDGSTTQGTLDQYNNKTGPFFPGASGTGGAAHGTSPSITGEAEQKGGADANVAQANAFEQYTGGYVNRKANLENLRTAAAQIPTGPNAPFWASLGALKQEYAPGTTLNIGPNATATANFEEVKKVAAAVLAQQRESMGLPNTNQSVTLSTGATPGEETSPLGIQRLAGLLEGNEDYGNAARQAWETWKSAGNGRATYQEFLNGWNKVFDPRVFQAQYFDPAEQAVVKKEIPNYAAQVAAAKRLGYMNAP